MELSRRHTRGRSFRSGLATSAVWFDYDNDGLLDLFVCNFVEFTAATPSLCGLNPLQKPFYCTPRVFRPRASVLYHNQISLTPPATISRPPCDLVRSRRP